MEGEAARSSRARVGTTQRHVMRLSGARTCRRADAWRQTSNAYRQARMGATTCNCAPRSEAGTGAWRQLGVGVWLVAPKRPQAAPDGAICGEVVVDDIPAPAASLGHAVSR